MKMIVVVKVKAESGGSEEGRCWRPNKTAM
jgi:hypothetical protein